VADLNSSNLSKVRGRSAAFLSTPTPLFVPFLKQPLVVSMGLSPLSIKRWIEPDEQFQRYHQNKLALDAQQPNKVYAELACSFDAQTELSTLLVEHLKQYHGGLPHSLTTNKLNSSNTEREALRNTHNVSRILWHTSLLVQDDICLLQEFNREYRLTAASLCAPSEWCVQDKIGRPISDIHAPVPRLNKKMGKQINHVFAKLSPKRPFERFNWSLKDTDALALFPDRSEKKLINDNIFLRVERQTIVRLPKTKAIAFTIRVYTYPIERIANNKAAMIALKSALDNMSNEEISYKSMGAFREKIRQMN
jgi:hypothetical protein